MRKMILTGAIFLSAITAANADARFQGDFFITEVTKACEGVGYNVGNYGRVRFRPAGVDGNGTHTGFGIHYARYASGYLTKGKPSSKYKGASAGGVGSNSFTWTGSKVKYSKLSPSKITASTESIVMEVSIKKFDNVQGCNVTLSGAVTKRP